MIDGRAPRSLDRRRDLVLAGSLLALAAAAWLVVGARMSAMEMAPSGEPEALGAYVGIWVAMTIAMMLPTAVPMVLVFDRVHRHRRRSATAIAPRWGEAPALLFAGGYLFAWTALGLGAYAVDAAVGSLVAGGGTATSRAGAALSGAVVLAAGAYQLTPLKRTCLATCRDPLGFLLARWRDGAGGALRMGAEHGVLCAGCCWALMVAVLAAGLMGLGWMAAVATLIAMEKLLPWERPARHATAVLLVAVGVASVLGVPAHIDLGIALG